MEKLGVIKTGQEGKYYEIYKCEPFNIENGKDILENKQFFVLIDKYGLAQIINRFIRGNGKEVPHSLYINIIYGNIAPLGTVIEINEFMDYNPIIVRLKEIQETPPPRKGSYLNKMSSIFPYFGVYDYNLLEE